LRHFFTSQEVEGLSPDEVIGIFSIYLLLSAALGLRITQPLTEMSIRNRKKPVYGD
jgi:hypothetical protein